MPTIRAIADGDLTGEPLFAAVRRRHRDVDIVLLPPESPPSSDELPGREELELVPQRLAAELAALGPAVADEVELVPVGQPGVRFGTVEGSVRFEARQAAADVPLDLGLAALSTAGRELATRGWEVGVPDDGVPRVLADRWEGNERRALVVTYVPEQGSYSVTLATGPLVVGRAAARRLVRQEREAL